MKKIILILAAMVSLGAMAVEPNDTTEVSRAFGTVWGTQILPALQRDYPDNNAAAGEFMQGINDALSKPAGSEVYYQGVLQGFTVRQRINQMRELGFPVDDDTFLAALAATLRGESTGYTATTADRYLNDFMARRMEEQMAADTIDRAAQQQFIDSIASIDGVITTPSGLVFQVITEGEGQSPVAGDDVAVIYTGRLWDGTVFDDAEEPTVLPVSGLVPGFTEGLTMMKPGGTYRIIIPPSLAYGTEGIRGVIPGNAALDFNVTLWRVLPK